jgi:hypothetical protein
MRLTRLLPAAVLLALIAACGDDDGHRRHPKFDAHRDLDGAPVPSVTASATPTHDRPTHHPPRPTGQPLGFPIDAAAALGVVTGDVGSRKIEWGAGRTLSYTRDAQASTDADTANRSAGTAACM